MIDIPLSERSLGGREGLREQWWLSVAMCMAHMVEASQDTASRVSILMGGCFRTVGRT